MDRTDLTRLSSQRLLKDAPLAEFDSPPSTQRQSFRDRRRVQLLSALTRGHRTPHSPQLEGAQGVLAALSHHGALSTDPLGPIFEPVEVSSAQSFGEEHMRGQAAAAGLLLPGPYLEPWRRQPHRSERRQRFAVSTRWRLTQVHMLQTQVTARAAISSAETYADGPPSRCALHRSPLLVRTWPENPSPAAW